MFVCVNVGGTAYRKAWFGIGRGRRGGEEFVIILPDTGFEAVLEVITRLLNAPFHLTTELDGQNIEVEVRLSYGVTIYPENGSNGEQLHHQAEHTMFQAKDLGRNMCHYWRSDGNHLQQRPD